MTAPHLPALHRVHPQGWINDPNGIVHVDGRWHVYFQHNPFSARHERIHWGHMSSPDLVTWRAEPLGPAPRPGEADRGGCWSGVATREDGREGAALVYSGVDDVDVQLSQVVVARTDATLEHLAEPGHVAAGVPEGLDLLGIRDPFLVELDGHRWAIQGAGLRDGTDEEGQERAVPALLLFDATDLDHWEYRGPRRPARTPSPSSTPRPTSGSARSWWRSTAAGCCCCPCGCAPSRSPAPRCR